MNSLAYSLLLIGAANAAAATALDADVCCALKALTDDSTNAKYSKFASLEAAATTVTDATCFKAAFDAVVTDAKAKVGCVEKIADSTDATKFVCQYTYEIAATADAAWDPRACEKGSSAGLITFGADVATQTGTWGAAATATHDA